MPRGADDPTELAGRLYDQYGASLYRYALMLLADPAAAEDVVQQVFASLMGAIQRNAAIDKAEHYLRRAIRNECYSTLRRTSREPAGSASGGALLTSLAGIDERPDERLALERALKTLPPEQREVVHLRVYEGMTLQEIASQTDESINTIASRYRYALEKLKAQLT
jgi:RNA polymerase sigma-70 factor, ECF subfamily